MTVAIKAKLVSKFPATVAATSPITVAKSGLTFTFGWDSSPLADQPNPVPSTYYFVSRNGSTYEECKLADMATAIFANAALTGNPTAPTASPGDNDTSIATTAFVQAAIPSSFTGDTGSGGASGQVPAPPANSGASGQVLGAGGTWVNEKAGFRNRIINGAMAVSQRYGTSSTALATLSGITNYSVDRWAAYKSASTPAGTFQQQTSLSVTGKRYALRVQKTAADANNATLKLAQVLETSQCFDLQGKKVTLSFQARRGANFSAASSQLSFYVATGTGADGSLANFDAGSWTGYAALTTQVATLSATMARFTYTFDFPSTALQIGVMFQYLTTGTAGAADYFEITEVQLEPALTATDFEFRPYPVELAMCQRFYWTATVLVPATTAVNIFYKQSMRANPTIAGGGTGFTTSNAGTDASSMVQTSAANQTLTFNAEL